MPLPTPTDGESQDEFLGRCMADETMNAEYPEQEQRAAVCQTQWGRENAADDTRQPPDGSWKYCVCPDCDYSEEHEAGAPCAGKACPKCGAKLEPSDDAKGFTEPIFTEDTDNSANVEVPAERDKRHIACGFKIASIDRDERTAVFAINSDNVDRDREVLLPNGAKLDAYRKNPVVLYGHNYDSLPIGKSLWIKKVKEGDRRVLVSKVQFARTQFATEVFELVADGFLQTASVGFLPDNFEGRAPTDKELEKYPDWSQARRVYDSWDLLEWSVVPVPSNPFALARAVLGGRAKLPSGFRLTELSKAGLTAGDDVPDAWTPNDYIGDAHEATFAPVDRFEEGTLERSTEIASERSIIVITGKEPDRINDGQVTDGQRTVYRRYYPVTDWTAAEATEHAVDLKALAVKADRDRVRKVSPDVQANDSIGEVKRVQAEPPKPEPACKLTDMDEIRRVEEDRARGRIIY